MGARNPFRISVDARTGFLYFGDIGPDANAPARKARRLRRIQRGPAARQLRLALLRGRQQALPEGGFRHRRHWAVPEPGSARKRFAKQHRTKVLPPAQKPFIWYTHAASDTFPGLGTGGRSALAGPVYAYQPGLAPETRFPAYYDGACSSSNGCATG
jgi:cytochrome c